MKDLRKCQDDRLISEDSGSISIPGIRRWWTFPLTMCFLVTRWFMPHLLTREDGLHHIVIERADLPCDAIETGAVFAAVPVQSASLLDAIAASSSSRSRGRGNKFRIDQCLGGPHAIRQRQDIPDRDANELKAATPGAAPRKAFETFMAAI